MPGALAARCTACGTVFRVVPDQLRVSEGWVRCGRCAEVFNAAENLVDVETGTVRPAGLAARMPRLSASQPALPRPAAAPAGPQPAAADDLQADPPAPDPDPRGPEPQDESRFETAAEDSFAPTTEPGASARDAFEDASPAADFAAPAPQPDPEVLVQSGPAEPGAQPALVRPLQAQPSFLRQAERNLRWRHPRVRLALAVLAFLAAVTLVGQVTHTWRDRLAAHWPAARPVLEQACAWIGCSLPPARDIAALTVESSGLVRIDRTDLYRLQLVLRNRSDIELGLPALELSLTDAQGRLSLRKVLYPEELGSPDPGLGPGQERSLQATLQVLPTASATPGAHEGRPDPRARAVLPTIAGYTVDLFYP